MQEWGSVGVWTQATTMSHHSSKATSTKQHGYAAAGSSSKASSMMTAWKRYLGHHSQPSNTALWGTQQTGLAFHTRAAALLDDWLCVTMQSNRTTHSGLYRGLAGDWWFRSSWLFTFPCEHSPPFYEYQFHLSVYLANIVISKSNKQPVCVGTAHYFPDRCMRDGYRVEVQQEMRHLSVPMTERSI